MKNYEEVTYTIDEVNANLGLIEVARENIARLAAQPLAMWDLRKVESKISEELGFIEFLKARNWILLGKLARNGYPEVWESVYSPERGCWVERVKTPEFPTTE